jgi:hypothetical protein
MSNLFKSKFFLGSMIVATLLVGVVAVKTAAAQSVGSSMTATTTATCTISTTLRVGSKGADVKCLQSVLDNGLVSDGHFGPKTKAEVVAWQKSNGLTADGVVGAKSRAVFNKGGTVVVTPVTGAGLPSGCATTSGFSPVSGVSCSSGTAPQGTGPVSVSLSSDNPASGYVINNQATADLAHFTFTGSGTVTSVTLQRTGISDQNTLNNVYLFQGNTRLTDGYSFNNSGILTMNGLSIAVNGSTTISVKADASSTASDSSTIGVTLTSYTAGTTATAVSLAGNVMYLGTSGSNSASVYVGTNTITGTQNVNAGTSAYTIWSAPVQINQRAIWLKGANFRMTGSAPSGSLGNINLFVDGSQVGTSATMGTITGSNYAMFDFSASPVSLSTGSHTVSVEADIVKGASYDVTASLQQASDLTLYDSQVGINVAAQNSSGHSFTSNSGADIAIQAGTAAVNVDPTFQTITNITGGATNVPIARFKVHGYGEDVKVSTLYITPIFTSPVTALATATTAFTPVVTVGTHGAGYMKTPTVTFSGMTCSTGTPTQPVGQAVVSSGAVTGVTIITPGSCTSSGTASGTIGVVISAASATQNGLNNLAVFFNGSQVGSSQTWTTTSGTVQFNLGSQMIIPAGTDSYIEVRADLQDNDSVNYTNGSVSANLTTSTGNAQGQTSSKTLNFPTGSVTGTVLSIQTGLLAVSSDASLAATQTASPNTAGVVIGSYAFQNQSTSESVRVTQLQVGLTSTPVGLTNLSNLRTSETSGSGSNPIQPSSSNTFSVNFTLAPGATRTIQVLADTGAANSETVHTTLVVTAIGATSNVSTTSATISGQTVNLSAGTLTTPTQNSLSSNSTAGQYVPAASGAVNATKATFNFASTNGASTITELTFTLGSGSNSTISSLTINGLTAYNVGNTAYFTGLNIAVPNGGSGVNQDVYVTYAKVGQGGVSSGTASALTLTTIKYQSGGLTSSITGLSIVSPTMTMVGTAPTVALNAASGTLTVGSLHVADVTVTANAAGDLNVNTIPLTFIGSQTGTHIFTMTTFATSDLVVKDSSGTPLTGYTPSVVAAGATCPLATSVTGSSSVCALISFANGYQVPAGTTKTFQIFANVTAINTGTGNSLAVGINPVGSFTWTDTAGNSTSPVAAIATTMPSYPTSTVSLSN